MATTNKNLYLPGETISVYVSGGYHDGWARIVLFDENMNEVARAASTRYVTGAIAPCCGPSFGYSGGITLSGSAPLAEGTYTWNGAWYGNKFEISDSGYGGTPYYGPRWTPDPNNPNHGYEIVSTNTFTVSAVPIPIATLSPTSLSFGSIAVGGTSTAKTANVSNGGNGDLHVTSIAPCAGTTTNEYSWTPAAPLTIAPATAKAISFTYKPVNSGSDNGCIDISTDDSSNPILKLAVSGSGYVPVILDLDIAGFSVTPSISLKGKPSIAIQLSVLNPGTASGSAAATVTGTRNGTQIYSQSLSVSDTIGDTTPTVFTFPSYKPTATGTINWTVTIADSNTDVDTASATTTVSR